MRLAAFNGPSPKILLQTQKSHRYLLHKPSYSQFCPKFRWHGNGGRWENVIGSIRWPIPEPPYRPRRKNLAKISYASRVIAHFVPNFVAMATRGQRGSVGENAIGSIQWLITENPPIDAKISQISLTQADSYPILSQISLP